MITITYIEYYKSKADRSEKMDRSKTNYTNSLKKWTIL